MSERPPPSAPAPVLSAAGAGEAAAEPSAARPLGLQAKLAVALVAIAAVAALAWPRGEGGFEAPGGFLLDATGRPQTLGRQMAPVTLVHFWSTWCPPCIDEVPAVDRLIADYAERPDFRVLMVAVQDEVGKVEDFLGGDAHSVLYDPQWEVAHRYDTRKLPESHLVVGGQVVESWRGTVDWDDPEVRERIDRALTEAGAEPAPPPT